MASHAGAAGMSIEDHRVASREHADGVAGQRRQRVSHRRDGADDAKGSIFRKRDTIFAAARLRSQELNARRPLAGNDEFFDLVLKPADFGFFHFFTAKRLGLIDADSTNAVHRFAAIFQAALLELLLGRTSSG